MAKKSRKLRPNKISSGISDASCRVLSWIPGKQGQKGGGR